MSANSRNRQSFQPAGREGFAESRFDGADSREVWRFCLCFLRLKNVDAEGFVRDVGSRLYSELV